MLGTLLDCENVVGAILVTVLLLELIPFLMRGFYPTWNYKDC